LKSSRTIACRLVLVAGSLILPGLALAGQPEPWQVNLQPAASPIMEMIHRFNFGLLIVVSLITLLVLALLVYCMVRFSARRNPIPSRTSHNTLVEVLWTIVPVLILVGIAVPSFSLLLAEHDPSRVITGYDPEQALTVKATGSQWFWTYDYPDNGGVSFASTLDENGQPRLLAVDNQMVVPTGTVIRMQVIGDVTGVIHAFTVPAFGIKIDAIPGRLNETWFRVDREGIYYGQCSELCGRGHAFMPIAVRAVSPEAFQAWVAMAATDLEGAYRQLATTAADQVVATAAE
jgi:cytochrome c oxidase subunit 2